MKKTARPQSAGSGSNPGPGRKRYFVNIVTQDQILEFQNEVSSKNVVPLLAPGKRENRLLILAPNTETIDTFQKRVLTQYQYNANVSAEAVKLLESHFCEVPRSYSVVDALDAKSEAYLVVQNIRSLGPGAKRKASEPCEPLSSGPGESPRSEPSSTKRVRRREKVARLTSSEPETPILQTPQPENSFQEQGGLPNPNQKEVPANAHTPLFGRSRAESERRLSASMSDSGAKQVDPPKPAAAEPAKLQAPGQPDPAGVSQPEKKSIEPIAAPETPKPKRGRPAKATSVPAPVAQKPPAAPVGTPKRSNAAKPSHDLQEEDRANVATPRSRENTKATQSGGIEKSEKTPDPSKPDVTLVGEPSVKKKSKDALESPQSNLMQNPDTRNEDVAESEMSTDASESEDHESSESESDSGERLRRLSRRRVVAVPNGRSSASDRVNNPKTLQKDEQVNGQAPVLASSDLKSELRTEPKSTNGSKLESADPVNNEPPTKNAGDKARPAGPAPSRVPGLGNLADLANMRLPTVHEQNRNTSTVPAKKPVDEESSEEEEDDNDSEDSNDSDSSGSDSSDEDASTAGRKGRKRGLLGLLGNK